MLSQHNIKTLLEHYCNVATMLQHHYLIVNWVASKHTITYTKNSSQKGSGIFFSYRQLTLINIHYMIYFLFSHFALMYGLNHTFLGHHTISFYLMSPSSHLITRSLHYNNCFMLRYKDTELKLFKHKSTSTPKHMEVNINSQ